MTITCTRFSKIPCFCPACTQGAIMTPPPEPESYSSTSTGTPAPLSPDVAELVRKVRQVDYAEDAGGYLLKDEVNQLADAYERVDDHNCELQKEVSEYKRTCERLAAENAKLRERAEKAEAERDELLASHQKVVGEHNGLVLAGDSLLAKAGQYRIERDAALAKCRELEETLQSLQTK